MRITIDYNGSIAECRLVGCFPTAQDPDVDFFTVYNFNEADRMSQIIALDAFRTIEENWKRNNKKEK